MSFEVPRHDEEGRPVLPGPERAEELVSHKKRFNEVLRKLAIEAGEEDLLDYVTQRERSLKRLEYELKAYEVDERSSEGPR